MEFRINTLTTFSSTFGWLINKCPPTCPYQNPNMSSQVYKINSHGDLSLVAAWMNLIFTSHSIDFQLISTYFSLFVADFSDFFLHSSLWCSRRFMLFFHSSRYFFPSWGNERREKNTNIYSVCRFYHPVNGCAWSWVLGTDLLYAHKPLTIMFTLG